MSKRPNASVTKTPAPRPSRVRKTLGVKDSSWRAIGTFLTSRSRDLALVAIVIGAFVAVFEGSLYSAKTFGFSGWSAIAFAVMPDALMVLAGAKMRQSGISAAQHTSARTSMYYGLVFSLLTNMIAAFLKYAPAAWISPMFLLVGAVAYHGVVVIFLWRAAETLLKVRADRKVKPAKASEVPASVNPLPDSESTVTVAPVPLWSNGFRWADTALALAKRS